jgi:serine/threonine-protein phosphatase PGAM5
MRRAKGTRRGRKAGSAGTRKPGRAGKVRSAGAALAVGIASLGAPATDAPATEAPAAPEGIHYVYLIRHGYYVHNDSSDERTENGINTLGREQARLVGRRLAALPVKPRLLVSSDFTRARQTADEVGKALGMKPRLDSLIAECIPNSSRPGLDEKQDPAEMAQCVANLETAWSRYFTATPERDTHDILVCHGNVIRWFVSRALGNDVRHWTNLDIGNASLTIVAVRPDGTTRLVMYSDVGHLPIAKQTWAGRGPGWSKAPR